MAAYLEDIAWRVWIHASILEEPRLLQSVVIVVLCHYQRPSLGHLLHIQAEEHDGSESHCQECQLAGEELKERVSVKMFL